MTSHFCYDSSGSSTRWLMKTCRLLVDDAWPCDQPLSFDGSGFHDDSRDEANQIFFSALLQHGKGKRLNLKNITLTLKSRKSLDEILSSNVDLQSLNLCNISCDDRSRCLPGSLFSKTNIQELRIEKCNIDSEAASAIGKQSESGSLRSLKLISVNLGGDVRDVLNGIASGSLCHLELCQSRIEQKHLSFALHSLSTNTKLESLYLDDCAIGSRNADDLADLVATNKHLKTLSLYNNDLDGKGIEILTERGLRDNTTLQNLRLSRNPIGDVGAKHLAKLLCSNPTIESLTLVDCDIWGPGCLCLARGLTYMRGLKQLVVDGEWEDHVQVVLKSMESNMTLVHLDTARTPMLVHKDPQWRKLEFYLRLNRSKRRILMDPRVSDSWWPRVLADISDDASLVYHMLRHKPELAS
jgi:hypothetical protein